MKQWLVGVAIAALGVAIAIPEAEAKRVGGARSSGAQRSITSTPPSSVPAKPGQTSQMNQAAPSQQPAAPAGATAPVGAAQPASGLGRWLPMLGGLAAGGLLASMLGGSGALGGIVMAVLMIGLLAVGGMFLMRMLAQRNAPAPAPATGPMQYSGLGSETVAAPPPSQAAGFDRGSVAPAPAPRVPAGFDAAGFARGAKMNYLKLQMANDSGNLDEIREFTTPEMYEELARDVAARGGAKQHTEILSLEADVLEVVTEGATHWASVRFTGAERSGTGQPSEAFEEVWNLSKPVDGSGGWVLAGIQQMH